MNTKALRQKILDLAIHGKLVPQNPKDESATVLLERIRAEKAEKIKQGELKADKKDSFIWKVCKWHRIPIDFIILNIGNSKQFIFPFFFC